MRRPGFTLVEVMLAATLLALVMMLLFNLYPTAWTASRRAQNQLEAHALAESLLEEYGARPFTSLVAGTTLTPEGGEGLRPTLRIREVEGADPSRLVELEVTVRWEERGKTCSTTYAAYVSNLSP